MPPSEKVLIFFTLSNNWSQQKKICSPCITISSDGGINIDLAGMFLFVMKFFMIPEVMTIYSNKVIDPRS